jgi:hypothetical protein
MGLALPENLALFADAHGIKPSAYRVEFADEPQLGESLWNTGTQWKQRLCKLQSIEAGYGSGPFYARWVMWNPDGVEAQSVADAQRDEWMQLPVLGQRIRIWIFDDRTGDQGEIAFKGTITGVHDSRNESGLYYSIEAVSDAARLDDKSVTFSCNVQYDPLHPNPEFYPDGTFLLQPKLRTVAGLVRTVLSFPDAFNHPDYWRWQDLDWSQGGPQKQDAIKPTRWEGFFNDPRCGAFLPADIHFEDTPKGKAIEAILQAAGNYSFLFVPGEFDAITLPDQSLPELSATEKAQNLDVAQVGNVPANNRDRLVIVELNRRCNRCGDKWELTWPEADHSSNPGYVQNYAFQHTVMNDETEWSLRDVYNMVRVVSGHIRLYSGHYRIGERLDAFSEGGVNVTPDMNIKLDRKDTVDAQRKRSTSLESTWYRFTSPDGTSTDRRKDKVYWVGLPLYPDWDVHSAYHPALLRINDVTFDPQQLVLVGGPTAPTTNTGVVLSEDDYRGKVEWHYKLVGDLAMQYVPQPQFYNHLRTYQAYYTDTECPSCSGTGLVSKVYDNETNTPDFKWLRITASGLKDNLDLSHYYTLGKGEAIAYQVTNYLFPPNKFGANDAPYDSLSPWSSTPDNPYPQPWKNLCPACRGTGMKPGYPIRNINPGLFAGRANQDATHPTDNTVIRFDPDVTSTGPETLEDTLQREVYNYGPQVQCEYSMGATRLPLYTDRNKMFDVQRQAAAGIDQAFKFDHPLKDYKRLIAFWFKNSGGSSDTVVPDTERTLLPTPNDIGPAIKNGCFVPYSTISPNPPSYQIDYQLGKVIFTRPMVVAAERDMFSYVMVGDKYKVQTNGLLQIRPLSHDTKDQTRLPTGFWRHRKVWMSFFYVKDKWYEPIAKDKYNNNTPIATTEVTAMIPDDTAANGLGSDSYYCRAMVVDGRLALDIIKKDPQAEIGPFEFATGNRLKQTTIDLEAAQVETFERDLYTYPVPSDADFSPKALEKEKTDKQEVWFPFGKTYRIENTVSPAEKQKEIQGYTNEDFTLGWGRPRPIEWGFRDERSRMLRLGIHRLEQADGLEVNGSLTLVGQSSYLGKGLGYVDYPDRGFAAVKRLVYNFANGFETEIELTREDPRVGELPPTAKELQNDVRRKLTVLRRTFNRGGNSPFTTLPPPEIALDGHVLDGETGNKVGPNY